MVVVLMIGCSQPEKGGVHLYIHSHGCKNCFFLQGFVRLVMPDRFTRIMCLEDLLGCGRRVRSGGAILKYD